MMNALLFGSVPAMADMHCGVLLLPLPLTYTGGEQMSFRSGSWLHLKHAIYHITTTCKQLSLPLIP